MAPVTPTQILEAEITPCHSNLKGISGDSQLDDECYVLWQSSIGHILN